MDTDILNKLQAPFPECDIEWRAQQAGISKQGKPYAMVLAYVTNRAIMSRLDSVFGCMGWQNKYRDINGGSVECCISVWDSEKLQWIEKWDAADNTNIDATKGGRSGSMKRAAVQWGIGRYLYNLDATFANCQLGYPDNTNKHLATKCAFKQKGSADQWGYWVRPQMPPQFLPQNN